MHMCCCQWWRRKGISRTSAQHLLLSKSSCAVDVQPTLILLEWHWVSETHSCILLKQNVNCALKASNTDAVSLPAEAFCFRHAHTFPKEQDHCNTHSLLLPWLYMQVWSFEFLNGHRNHIEGCWFGFASLLPHYISLTATLSLLSLIFFSEPD